MSLYIIRFHVIQKLVGTFVGQGKATLPTQSLYITRLEKTDVQKYLAPLHRHFHRISVDSGFQLGIAVCGDAADAPIRTEPLCLNGQSQVAYCKLLDRRGAGLLCLGRIAKEIGIEILYDSVCNLLDILIRLIHGRSSFI